MAEIFAATCLQRPWNSSPQSRNQPTISSNKSKVQAQCELHVPHGLGDVEDLTRGIARIRAVGHEVGEIGDVENVEILPPELEIRALSHFEVLKERPVVHLHAGRAQRVAGGVAEFVWRRY